MRGGRDENHHSSTLTARGTATLLAALVLAAGSPARAETQKVTRIGIVHRVEVVENSHDAGTSIVHTLQAADGLESPRVLPRTQDAAPDLDPAIDIDPVLSQPVAVWTRDWGRGFDIYLSRFDGSSWSDPFPVLRDPAEDRSPRVAVTSVMVHVVWRQIDASGQTVWMRKSFDRATLEPAFGPEVLPTYDADPVPPEGDPDWDPQWNLHDPGMSASETDSTETAETGSGGSGSSQSSSSSPAPPEDASFFAGEAEGVSPGDRVIVVWGIRDEPVPVGYLESFLLPPEVGQVERIESGWVESRFALWFNDGHFRYAFRDSGAWSDLRLIRLEDGATVSTARQMMQEMLRRIGPDSAPTQ